MQFIEYKGISKNKFYSTTGLSNGFLDSGKSYNLDNLRKILDKYRDINVDWIVFNNGPMLKPENEKNESIAQEPAPIYGKNENNYQQKIEVLEKEIEYLKEILATKDELLKVKDMLIEKLS